MTALWQPQKARRLLTKQWVTGQNVVDIAAGETNYLDTDTQVKRIAINNKRITRWARTDNYKFFTEARKRTAFASAAFNISSSSSICLLS